MLVPQSSVGRRGGDWDEEQHFKGMKQGDVLTGCDYGVDAGKGVVHKL